MSEMTPFDYLLNAMKAAGLAALRRDPAPPAHRLKGTCDCRHAGLPNVLDHEPTCDWRLWQVEQGLLPAPPASAETARPEPSAAWKLRGQE